MEGNTRKDKPDQGGPVKAAKPATTVDKDVKMTGTEIPEGVDEETWEMIKVMGFGTFKTTKNTKVPGNDRNYCVRKDTMMKARQYMNRQGGFNRPLSPGR
jgi:U4/U6.U5 tri-snRNP-associated protein 3